MDTNLSFEDFARQHAGNDEIINNLKNALVRGQEYETAANVRKIELDHKKLPNIPDVQDAAEFSRLLLMVGIKTDMKTCFVLRRTAKIYDTIGDAFSIKDAARIQENADALFDETGDAIRAQDEEEEATGPDNSEGTEYYDGQITGHPGNAE